MSKNKLVIISIASVIIFSVLIYLERHSTAETQWGETHGSRIHGRVISTYGPVKNARVRVAGDEKYALTNSRGEYILPTDHVSGDRVWVTAGKEGWFNNGQIAYRSGRTRDIFLNPV
ncbi:MAG: hypothetical protein GWN86_27210, partial [Desulfobacterales bacterium]|nr:hypothetical protein [Desulfobacterales bacterium]